MKNKFLVLLMLIAVSLSCTEGVYPLLRRPAADPDPSMPLVQSFKEEKTVVVSWQADIKADTFVLYRKKDQAGAATEIVYKGTGLEYVDKNGEAEERYLYSLAKTRGYKLFEPGESVLGVFGSTIRDFSEPNNTKQEAAFLESDLEGNMWYYQDSKGNVLTDEDWYFVKVPSRMTAHLVIKKMGADNGKSYFYFIQEAGALFQVTNGADIPVRNYAHTPQNIYFKLYPVASSYVADLNQAGGMVAGYTLSLASIGALTASD